ncbi:hypothetical protein VTN77DRAFT_6941 [Rasamsonia byssochlamydoides]|uniref:uncharacterized protein n=1 Tax=Rasamsonia byssochlamydoides TaxID=89139 RepID=UPI0037447B64
MNLEDKVLDAKPGSNRSDGPIYAAKESKFAFSAKQLSELISCRDITAFYALGGLAGLEKGLRTDLQSGLSVDETILDGSAHLDGVNTPAEDAASTRVFTAVKAAEDRRNEPFADRKKAFRDNRLPSKKEPNLLQLMWMAYNDYVLFLLTAAAIISLGVGLYQTFATPHGPGNPPVEWVEGVAILVAIVIIVIVGAGNDYQKQRQFRKLNKKKQDRNVKVIRSARSQEIPIHDVLVGDVVHIEPGDIIPADGILIQGHRIRCDESSATGESDLLLKHSGDEVFRAIRDHQDTRDMDPFIISGAKVAEGIGTFLVVATGTDSSYGKILQSLEEDPGFTPLQVKLSTLAKHIARFGGMVAISLFIILFIKFLVGLRHSTRTPTQEGQLFINIFIIALTVVVIAVPEGLPLAVTLALAFATTRMLKDKNLVRQLKACEIMGNATNICSDKTGTLTQNVMTVVAGTIGTASQFREEDPVSRTMPAEGVSTAGFIHSLSADVRSILKQSIVVNSTAFEAEEGGTWSFTGSRTEAALLTFARRYLGMGPLDVERSNTKITRLFPFDASRKCMITVVQLDDGKYRAYVKGASELLLDKCTRIIEDPTKGLLAAPMTEDIAQHLGQIVARYAAQSLRTISLVYRDFEDRPPAGTNEGSGADVTFEDIVQDLVFLGVMGIRDPLREGSRDAVQACQRAGVVVRMVTGDNIFTAKAIAEECGIISSPDDVAMEGAEFRQLSEYQRDEIIPHLKVLARSSPEDKRALVIRLKEMGETVAVTGDGTNDAPALGAADVSFSMGISGTEVAREASSIILMDDNFTSIVKAIMWGRAVNDAVKKFLQFQITITITSVALAFISAVANAADQSVLTAVQLMWVNLFQDTLAALALATDPPPRRILDRKPDPKSMPLITVSMWKMIIGQSVYQLAVTLVLYFGGAAIFHYDSDYEKKQLQTAVFNTYVWMQIFNMYNNRQLENSFNVLEGIFHNWLFIAVSLIMIGGQVLIIFVGGDAFSVVPLTGAQWGYSLVLGALSILVGCVIRVIPDALVEALMERLIGCGRRVLELLKGRRG